MFYINLSISKQKKILRFCNAGDLPQKRFQNPKKYQIFNNSDKTKINAFFSNNNK